MEYIIALFILSGAIFTFVAALGTLRFPDTLSRTHAATKAGAFGASILLGAAALYFKNIVVLIEVVLIIAFFYTTTPIATHLLGRVISNTSTDSKTN